MIAMQSPNSSSTRRLHSTHMHLQRHIMITSGRVSKVVCQDTVYYCAFVLEQFSGSGSGSRAGRQHD